MILLTLIRTILYYYRSSMKYCLPCCMCAALFGLYVTFVTLLNYISSVLYCTVLYCIVLYCTVLYCTVLYCTVLYCTVRSYIYFFLKLKLQVMDHRMARAKWESMLIVGIWNRTSSQHQYDE